MYNGCLETIFQRNPIPGRESTAAHPLPGGADSLPAGTVLMWVISHLDRRTGKELTDSLNPCDHTLI